MPASSHTDFPATHHSAIDRAQRGDEAARFELATAYLGAIRAYSHAAANGAFDREHADDHAAEFVLANFVGHFGFGGFDAGKGRFRSYVRTAFHRFLTSTARRRNSKERGGHVRKIASHGLAFEAHPVAVHDDPEIAFDRALVADMLHAALESFETQHGSDARRAVWLGMADGRTFAEVEAEVGLSKAQQRTLRARFQILVRRRVEATLVPASRSPRDVLCEIVSLSDDS